MNKAALILVLCIGSVLGEEWWQHAVFYQIYPRSFKDNSNDGLGDLQGITSKLNYIKETGIPAIWLSPIFKSPGVDQGYDISDYQSIDGIFGTKEDFETLLKKAQELQIKVILDFVPNHTSDLHEWFNNSVNRVEGYEDFYIWRDARKDEEGNNIPPNNWISLFKGSAWTWNEIRQQYYLHQFAPQQPDLNYRNPAVVQAMKDVLTYWMEMGVDGFRCDAVPYLFEDEGFQDEPRSNVSDVSDQDYEYLDHIYTMDLDGTFDMIYQWRDHVDGFSSEGDIRILMTEAYTTFENTLLYYGSEDGSRKGAHFSFNFDFITYLKADSKSSDYVEVIKRWVDLPLTPNWVLGNHDQHRVASRFGTEKVDGLNMLMAVLPGVQVTYNGEEIGQEDGKVSCEEGQDPSAIKNCSTFDKVSRDFERTPFHWDNSTNAGFNQGAKPWLPVSEKYLVNNLEDQKLDEESHYNIYKNMLNLRKDLVNADEFQVEDLNSVVIIRNLYEKLNDCQQGLNYTFVFNLNEEAELPVTGTVEVLGSSGNSDKEKGSLISNKITLKKNEAVFMLNSC